MEDTIEISHSETARFRRCKRAWWFEYVRKLGPKRHGPSAANIGTLFHLMAEDWRTGEDDPFKRARAYFDARHAEMEAFLHDEHEKNWRMASVMFEGFMEWWDDEAMDHDWERLSSEQRLKMQLHTVVTPDGLNVSVVFKGKIDERVRNNATNEITYLDYKTVQNLTDIPKRAPRDEQFLGYELLMRANYPASTSDGGIWVMSRKVLRGKQAKPPFFGVHEAKFNRHQLENMLIRLRGLADQMVLARWRIANGESHQTVVPPTPHKDCDWDCDFKLVCSSFDDGSRAEDLLTEHYVSINPYQRYEEDSK